MYKKKRTSFCENLRKYRKKMKYTQTRLAREAGYHRTYICALENGRINPTLDTLVNLSIELGIDPCHLLITTKRKSNED